MLVSHTQCTGDLQTPWSTLTQLSNALSIVCELKTWKWIVQCFVRLKTWQHLDNLQLRIDPVKDIRIELNVLTQWKQW